MIRSLEIIRSIRTAFDRLHRIRDSPELLSIFYPHILLVNAHGSKNAVNAHTVKPPYDKKLPLRYSQRQLFAYIAG